MAPTVSRISTVNEQLWQDYGERSTGTWTGPRQLIWEEHCQDPRWDQWRQQTRPEPNFQHTWRRFSHKVQAQCEHIQTMSTDYVVWLDLDVVEIGRPDYSVLTPRPGDLLSYLGRGTQYPETGWICYDRHHPRLGEFLTALEHCYLSNAIFELPQWHDAYVWDHVCRELQIPRTSLGPDLQGEAFSRSLLEPYFRHAKGPRKQNIRNYDPDDPDLTRLMLKRK